MRIIPHFINSITHIARQYAPAFAAPAAVNLQRESQKKHLFLHHVSPHRLYDIAGTEDKSQETFNKFIQTKEMRILTGSGRMGRADGVYVHPLCLDKELYHEQASTLVSFLLHDHAQYRIIFDCPQESHFMPYSSGAIAKFTGDDAIPVEHVVSKSPSGTITIYHPELWNKLVENLDFELNKHITFINEVCQQLQIPEDGTIQDKIAHIIGKVIKNPEQGKESLDKALDELRQIDQTCILINQISAEKDTYIMRNALADSLQAVENNESVNKTPG